MSDHYASATVDQDGNIIDSSDGSHLEQSQQPQQAERVRDTRPFAERMGVTLQPQEGPNAPSPTPQLNPDNGFASVTVTQDGSVVATETSKYVGGYWDPSEHARSVGSPVLSVRDAVGPITQQEATPDSIVNVAGWGEMKLSSALAEGLVERADDGSFVKPGTASGTKANQQPTKEQPEGPPKEPTHPDLLEEKTSDAQAEQGFDALVQGTDLKVQTDAAFEIAEDGALSDDTLNKMADQLGAEPDDVSNLIEERVRPAMEQQAKDVVGEVLGTKNTEVIQAAIDHFYQTDPKAMSEAIRNQITKRQTGGYRALADNFIQNLDTISPESILEHKWDNGVTAETNGKGQIVIRTPDGRSYDWKGALAMGLVKIAQ